jgi:hypothetical protein
VTEPFPTATDRPRVGCFPGSFDPPTVAHLAVADAVVAHGRLDRLDLVVSRHALGKDVPTVPTLDDRIAVLHTIARTRPWLGVTVTERRLVVDIAEGYDLVVMGADKWRQVTDAAWYPDGEVGRDRAIAALPQVVVVPRADDLPTGVDLLDVGPEPLAVSATAVRERRPHAAGWMVPEAAAFDAATGAWTDPDRYRSRR